MMTEQQIALVQSTFAEVLLVSEHAASLFYSRLFELDPSLKSLFHGNMDEQGRKLMKLLAVAVHSLDRLDEIVPAVQALGQRHAGYGVRAEDFDTVGEALLWTLAQAFGDRFTPDVEAAWTAAYTLLAQTAIDAAYGPEMAY